MRAVFQEEFAALASAAAYCLARLTALALPLLRRRTRNSWAYDDHLIKSLSAASVLALAPWRIVRDSPVYDLGTLLQHVAIRVSCSRHAQYLLTGFFTAPCQPRESSGERSHTSQAIP